MQTLASSAGPVLLLLGGVAGIVAGAVVWRERRDRRAVERALFGEILSMRWQAAAVAVEIARRYGAMEPFDTRFFTLWRLSEPLIYPGAGAAGLGLLPRNALGCIGEFHGRLADARARLASARTAGGFEPTPYRILACLVHAYHAVDPWLRDLRPRLGALPSEEPALTAVCKLLDEIEQSLEEPVAVAYCWVDCGYPDS